MTHDDNHIHEGTLGSLTENQDLLWALAEKLFSEVSS
jgi:hypothetical protein